MLSACGGDGGASAQAGPSVRDVLTNQATRRVFARIEGGVQACMRKEGFRYLRTDPTDNARSAGSEFNFTLSGRKSSGFGISELLKPRRAASQDPDPAFQDSVVSCRKTELKAAQTYFDAINNIGTDYLSRRSLLKATPKFMEFQKLYAACMTLSGYPGTKDSDAAFAKALVPYKAKLSMPEIKAVEIPIAVADFMCVTKYDHLRASALAAQEETVLESHEKDFLLLAKLQ